MRRADTQADPDARFATFLVEDGAPPCNPPDGCEVCVLFTHQPPDESRAEWLARITGSTRVTLEAAS